MHLRIFATTLLLLVPAIVSAEAPRTFSELADLIVIILDNATAVLIVAGLVAYFYGLSTNILTMGDESSQKLKAYFLWGVIILFVMVSIWGILRLIRTTLFTTNPYESRGVIITTAPVNSFNTVRYEE